jgi:hypothetical protein
MSPIATRLAAMETKFQPTPSSVMASVPRPRIAIPTPSRGSHGATSARSRLATRHSTLPATKVTTPSQSSKRRNGTRQATPGAPLAACSVNWYASAKNSDAAGEREPRAKAPPAR